ncbi:MAG: MATE family efflux transporter [Ignavibacteria bacterium]
MKNLSDRKLIISLAIPAVLQTVVRSLFVIVDAFWVGKINSLNLAALTIATFVVWGVLALGEIISTATNTLIAQKVGGQDLFSAKTVASQNLVNTVIFSFVLGIFLIPLLRPLFQIMNTSPEQSELALKYLTVLLLGLPCVILLLTVASIFRGYGNTRMPFYLLLLAITLNFIFAPLLIFGIEGLFEGYGIVGAALSTLISFAFSAIIGYKVLLKRNLIFSFLLYKVNLPLIKETFRIGVPTSISGVAFSLIYVLVSKYVADYGTVGFASLGIGHRSESLIFQITVGFSLASTILVGQNVGAGNTKRAETLAWKIFGVSAFVVLIYSVILFIFSREIAMIFTNDNDVITAASMYNKISSLVQIFSAAEIILTGAFIGAGDTLPPTLVAMPLNFLRIPLSGIFSSYFGLTGIWIAICITVFFKGILIALLFKTGRWKKKKVKI